MPLDFQNFPISQFLFFNFSVPSAYHVSLYLGITQEQEKIINFEIDPDLLFMVPDFVHKFEMVWLVEIKLLS
jgi:hypothetical protein